MYRIDVLVQGFPGKAVCHGGLGWSTIALLRSGDRAILVDVGAFGIRKPLANRARRPGVCAFLRPLLHSCGTGRARCDSP